MTMTPASGRLNPTDVLVLRAVNRFRYLTASQLNRLLWPGNTRDKGRYAQLRLKSLADGQYLQVLDGLPRPGSGGTAPYIYALARRGRRVLTDLGEPVPAYYRPGELDAVVHNPLFMPHTLAVIDVLIAAERLTHANPAIRFTQLRSERELRQRSMRVTVLASHDTATARHITVVPDAVFSLAVAGVTQDFVLELDRGSERRVVWQRKVAALTAWIDAPAGEALLPSEYLRLIVVTTSPARREQLRVWTGEELTARGLLGNYGRLFAISDSSPVALSPEEFFAGAHWHPPFAGSPDSLIELPVEVTT
jgi:protein involved in plasmid replication-relaxation